MPSTRATPALLLGVVAALGVFTSEAVRVSKGSLTDAITNSTGHPWTSSEQEVQHYTGGSSRIVRLHNSSLPSSQEKNHSATSSLPHSSQHAPARPKVGLLAQPSPEENLADETQTSLPPATEEDAAAAVQAAEAQVGLHASASQQGEEPKGDGDAPASSEEDEQVGSVDDTENANTPTVRAKPSRKSNKASATNATKPQADAQEASGVASNVTSAARTTKAPTEAQPLAYDEDKDPLDQEIEEQLSKDSKLASQKDARAPPKQEEESEEPPVGEDRLRKRKVGELTGSIAEETGSRGLAHMLAGMKMDMFSLRDKVDALERTIREGVRLSPIPPEELAVYPLSTCMSCVLALAGLYFLLITAAGVNRVFTIVFGLGQKTKAELSLQAACETMVFAPMVCVLFLGAHLRAQQISGGEKGPGEATELAIQACVWSVITQTMLVLLVPVLTGEVVSVDEEAGLELPELGNSAFAGILALLRYTAMVGLYMGVAIVCAQTVSMDTRSLGVEPVDRWDDSTTAATEYAPPVSAAMSCTMGLSCLFFAVYALRFLLRSCLDFSGPEGFHGATREGHHSGARALVAHWEQCLQACAHAVSPAPMLCILFMAARMRAMQLDPKTGRPQGWAEMCFYESSVAVAVHAATIFLARAFGVSSCTGQPVAELEVTSRETQGLNRILERLVFFTRILSVLLVCWGFLGVISSMLLIRGPSSDKPLPPVSPALLSAFAFATMYFAVYVCVFLSQAFAVTSFSLGVASEGSAYLLRTVEVLQEAEYAVKLCPMLAVLFIGAWMRAELLSKMHGSLQCFARDAMYVAVASLLVQLFLSIAGSGGGLETEPQELPKQRWSPLATLVMVARATSLATLYGSVALVGLSVLVIRPETAICPA